MNGQINNSITIEKFYEPLGIYATEKFKIELDNNFKYIPRSADSIVINYIVSYGGPIDGFSIKYGVQNYDYDFKQMNKFRKCIFEHDDYIKYIVDKEMLNHLFLIRNGSDYSIKYNAESDIDVHAYCSLVYLDTQERSSAAQISDFTIYNGYIENIYIDTYFSSLLFTLPFANSVFKLYIETDGNVEFDHDCIISRDDDYVTIALKEATTIENHIVKITDNSNKRINVFAHVKKEFNLSFNNYEVVFEAGHVIDMKIECIEEKMIYDHNDYDYDYVLDI